MGSALSDLSMSSRLEVKNVIASFCIPDTLEMISSASEERERLKRVSPSAAESTQSLKMQVKRCNVCVISLSGDNSRGKENLLRKHQIIITFEGKMGYDLNTMSCFWLKTMSAY